LQVQTSTPLEKAAQTIVQNWDYVLAPDSIGAAIYSTFLRKLEYIVFNALLGDDETLLESYLGIGANTLAPVNGYASRNRPLLIRLLKKRDDTWFTNSAIPNGPRSWDTALTAAFHATIEELCDRFGNDISRWRYGAIHTMTYAHALGSINALRSFFNRGPFPVGGDIDTVNMGATQPNKPEIVVTVPSFRQIVDLGNLNNSLSGHAPGQSGHPASKHYDDFIPLWLHVQHHPMLFERKTIEANSEGTLHLRPA
jgi:penicillin amidase